MGRRRDVNLTVVEEVGEAAETNKKLGALLIQLFHNVTHIIQASIIGSASSVPTQPMESASLRLSGLISLRLCRMRPYNSKP